MHESPGFDEEKIGPSPDHITAPALMPKTPEAQERAVFSDYEQEIFRDHYPQKGSDAMGGNYETRIMHLPSLQSATGRQIVRPQLGGESIVRIYTELVPTGEPDFFYLEVGTSENHLRKVYLGDKGSNIVDEGLASKWDEYYLN